MNTANSSVARRTGLHLRTGTAVLIIGLGATALAGCTTARSDAAAPARSAHSGPSTLAGPPPAEPSPAQVAALYDAEEKLIQDCMRGHGFDYRPLPFSYPAYSLFPYGINDSTWAGVHGYGTPPSAQDTGSTASFRSLPKNQQQRYAEQLHGPKRGMVVQVTLPYSAGTIGHNTAGCEVDAESKLYGTFNTWFEYKSSAHVLLPQVEDKVRAEPSYQGRVAAWARCMGDSGYSYPSPEAAAESFMDRPSTSRQAKSAASADAQCTASTGLGKLGQQLQDRAVRALPEQYRSLIYEFWTASLKAASRVRSSE